jgi:hypothetical protein
LHKGALTTPICRSPFRERPFRPTYQRHKTPGYCWRAQKCRNVCVPHAFFEGTKAGETSPRNRTSRTLKEVRQQYPPVKSTLLPLDCYTTTKCQETQDKNHCRIDHEVGSFWTDSAQGEQSIADGYTRTKCCPTNSTVLSALPSAVRGPLRCIPRADSRRGGQRDGHSAARDRVTAGGDGRRYATRCRHQP